MKIRNIAIIAHVDHGKTTLVDNLLKQSGVFRDNQIVSERIMDSNELEKERGITISAKCTSLQWHDVKINIIDTPGHADFGGEVERILTMVDGVILLVDSSEGPMPQTKFVLSKALKLNLKTIVVINKIDKTDARTSEVLDEIFELFISLEASNEQADFPVLYASGRDGWAVNDENDEKKNLTPLFDSIINNFPAPKSNTEEEFSMIVTAREYDQYLGRILTGKIETGIAKVNMPVKVLSNKGEILENGRITKLLTFEGMERKTISEALAGDIVLIAGLNKSNVSDTLCSPQVQNPLPSQPIDPPTLSMTFSVNTSPLAGQEGNKLTSTMLKERLYREAESNVAITITELPGGEKFKVSGRGELQIGILIETMRREGFEMTISKPEVIYKTDPETKKILEPNEIVQIDVDEEYSGTIISSMNIRKAEIQDIKQLSGGKTRIIMLCPSRSLIGYHGTFLTETRGTGIMSRIFDSYQEKKGDIEGRRNGVLVSTEKGNASAYALFNLEDRGIMFVKPGDIIYKDMIIGEHNKENDLFVNPVKSKQLTNMRSTGKDKAIKLTPTKILSLEQIITYIQDDEVVEVTPKSVRMRKILKTK